MYESDISASRVCTLFSFGANVQTTGMRIIERVENAVRGYGNCRWTVPAPRCVDTFSRCKFYEPAGKTVYILKTRLNAVCRTDA
jgi:hypothetical protein